MISCRKSSKKESLKQRDGELQLLKKEHADELNQLHLNHMHQLDGLIKDVEIYKSQTTGQVEINTLLKEETRYKTDLTQNTEKKFRKLDDELKVQKLLKMNKT